MARLLQSIVLIILAVPAFSGLGLTAGPVLFLDINAGRLLYGLIISAAIYLLRGRFLWLTANVIAALIIIPVVAGGALLALLLYLLGFGGMNLTQIAAHYVFLFINMAAMIPLGIALASLVPAAQIESLLLRNARGVNTPQKALLMTVRVFNHVVFAVVPEIMQAVTQELRFNGYLYKTGPKVKGRRRLFIKAILQKLMFVAVTALCSSLRYLPLWTAEISALPGKKQKGREIPLLFKTGVIVVFIALAFLGTLFMRVPIPATGGYVNLGDSFVMLAGMFFGPLAGFLTGALGPAIADFIGFPQFVPATAATKGLEGLIVGLIAYKNPRLAFKITALVCGMAVMAAGYFMFEAFIYPFIGQTVPFFAVTDIRAAVLEIFPNLLQGACNAVLSLLIWRIFKGRKS